MSNRRYGDALIGRADRVRGSSERPCLL